MKAFANVDASDPRQAAVLSQEARARGQAAAFVGGGSDLLAQMKLRLVEPDVLVNLKTIGGLDRVSRVDDEICVGGLITLDALARWRATSFGVGSSRCSKRSARATATSSWPEPGTARGPWPSGERGSITAPAGERGSGRLDCRVRGVGRGAQEWTTDD